jgi:hypothetical protein
MIADLHCDLLDLTKSSLLSTSYFLLSQNAVKQS